MYMSQWSLGHTRPAGSSFAMPLNWIQVTIITHQANMVSFLQNNRF